MRLYGAKCVYLRSILYSWLGFGTFSPFFAATNSAAESWQVPITTKNVCLAGLSLILTFLPILLWKNILSAFPQLIHEVQLDIKMSRITIASSWTRVQGSGNLKVWKGVSSRHFLRDELAKKSGKKRKDLIRWKKFRLRQLWQKTNLAIKRTGEG